jgi:hypothetical protein
LTTKTTSTVLHRKNQIDIRVESIDKLEEWTMAEIHLYGRLRQLVPDSRANEETVLHIHLEEEHSLKDFIAKLNLKASDVGECFINGMLAEMHNIVTDDDRVGLFPFNMRLIDGAMHLRYHPNRR